MKIPDEVTERIAERSGLTIKVAALARKYPNAEVARWLLRLAHNLLDDEMKDQAAKKLIRDIWGDS